MDIVTESARILWEYLRMDQQVAPADAICALGSDSKHVAVHAAELWLKGYAPYLIVSGGQGSGLFGTRTEADVYAEIAEQKGVPRGRIIREPHATNTGENISYIKRMVENEGYGFRSFVLVHKPYMERRVYATFQKVWPEASGVVTSPPIPFDNYARDVASRDRFAVHLMSTFYRIREYAARGFQIEQHIPFSAQRAYDTLMECGYRPTL